MRIKKISNEKKGNRMTRVIFILSLLTVLNQQNYCQTKMEDLEKANEKISFLGNKIDSLSREFEKDKIAKDFFSSQISIQTTIYSVIATLAVLFISLFNYFSLKKDYKRKLNQHRKSVDNLIEQQKKQFDEVKEGLIKDIQDIKTDIMDTQEITDMYIYYSVRKGTPKVILFNLALKLATRSYYKKETDNTLIFLNLALKDVDELKDKVKAKEGASGINKILDFFMQSGEPNIESISKEIKEKYNLFCWAET